MTSILTGSYWSSLGAALIKTIRTYPRESLIAFVLSIALCVAVADPENGVEKTAIRTSMGLALGIAISIGSTVLYRSGKINAITDWLFASLAVTASTWHAQYLNFDNADGIVEYVYLLVLVHVFAASAWSVSTSVSTFWNANTSMFYRILFAFVFTSLLVTGLTTATAAIRVLFGLLSYIELEGYLTAFAYGFFMTLFFLAEMPTHESSRRESIVPKLTISFVQYVLVPLVAIFTAILYAYAVKLLTTSISTDMAVYVVWLTGSAILASLLTWPLRNEPKPLLKFVHTWLYPLMLPLLMMGLWSLWTRYTTEGIDHVGFTLGVLTSVGLLTVVISMALRRTDPRIPAIVSLVVFALTSVGPFGVNAVVDRSQQDRAATAAEKSNQGNGGGLPPALDDQPEIAAYTNVDRWVVAFSCSVDDTLKTSDAMVVCNDKGQFTAVHNGLKDTVRFNIREVLSQIKPGDTLYKPVTVMVGSQRKATLICSSITTYSGELDEKTAPRTIGQIRGSVYCEPR